jgi:hypothetical protein
MTIFDAQGNYINGPELPLATRTGDQIPNEQRMARAPASMNAAKDIVLQAHPEARARSLGSVYNCMGMVFGSRRTWIEPEHLTMILIDDDYRQVIDESSIQPGDVVVYRDDDGQVSHVGIVAVVKTNVSEAEWEVLVLSQWGQDGEYFHLAKDVNPLLGKPAEYWTDRI